MGQVPASRPLRVKLIGNWGPSAQLRAEWERMSQGGGRWNSIEVTSDDDVDFWVIVNTPWPGEEYRSERTIVFQMEPWCHGEHQTWGVKTWGEWARPDPAKFLQVRPHRHFPNNAFWQLAATYDELRTQPVRKTGVLSAIVSGKYFDPGHIQRVDFLRYIEARDDDVVRVEMYAHDNPLEFSSWVGPHRPGRKDDALLPYRYFLGVENNFEHNFVTEKLWEPILTETLCFYTGAPNAAEIIDARAFVLLDLTDFEAAFATMRTAILADEWSRRVEYIRREKRKVLEHFQFFPTVERILRNEMGFTEPPSDVDVTYHAHFADAFDTPLPTVAFVHSYTRDGDTRILSEVLSSIAQSGLLDTFDRIYIVNVGDEISLRWTTETAGKVRLIQRTPNAGPGERLTLELVHAFAAQPPGVVGAVPAHQGGVVRRRAADGRRLAAAAHARAGGAGRRLPGRPGRPRRRRCEPARGAASPLLREHVVGERVAPGATRRPAGGRPARGGVVGVGRAGSAPAEPARLGRRPLPRALPAGALRALTVRQAQ